MPTLIVLVALLAPPAAGTAAEPGVGLVPVDCIADDRASSKASDGCAKTRGLDPVDLAMAPDGDALYAASAPLEAVVPFARAADGSLTPGACIEDNDDERAGCPSATDGLDGPSSIVATASSVHVGTGLPSHFGPTSESAVTSFARSQGAGLTPAGCVEDAAGPDVGCARSSPGLADVWGVAASPDGQSVYAVSRTFEIPSDAIVQFRPAGAGLEPVGCISDNDTGDPACAQRVDGLSAAAQVEVSPDGRSVYVASGGSYASADNAIVHFQRAADGSLTYRGCVDDNDFGPDSCARSTEGLSSALDLDLSADGKSLYAVSYDDRALVRFDVAADGSLTPAGCFEAKGRPGNCQEASAAMSGLVAVHAVGNDSIYVAAELGDSVHRFARAPDGALRYAGCAIADSARFTKQACDLVIPSGLVGAKSVVSSPDGKSLYVGGDNTIVHFRRDLDPPQTRIKGPSKTEDQTPTFKLKSSERRSTFECVADRKKPKECEAKYTTPHLKAGKHKLTATAIDPAGNPDPTPATKKFTVTK